MKFVVNKDILTGGVSKAGRITGRDTTQPALSGILFSAEDSFCVLHATNLDLGIEVSLSADVTEPGSCVLPGEIISSFLQARDISDTEMVTFELKGNSVHISTGSFRTVVRTLPLDGFPELSRVEKGVSCVLPAERLANALKSVWYSASSSTIKPELASIFIYVDDNKLTFAATDSFRLAEKKITNVKVSGNMEGILLPQKNAGEIIRNLDGVTGDVSFVVDEKQIALTFDGVYLTSRLIDGMFPDYKQILPKEHTTEAIVLKQELKDILKTSNVFSNKFNQIYFKVSPEKKWFYIETSNPDVGESKARINGSLTGESIEISFNFKYIMDVFQSLSADSVSMQWGGAGRPMVLRGVGDTTFLYLVMPMSK